MSVRQKKEETVKDIFKVLDESNMVLFADYRGLSVASLTSLRDDLYKNESKMTVYKNTLTSLALKEVGFEAPNDYLTGPLALISCSGDVAAASKVVTGFMKENESFRVKGGFFDKSMIDSSVLDRLSKLPSREVLLAKLVGGLSSPISGLVFVLSGQISNLRHVIHAVKEQKESN